MRPTTPYRTAAGLAILLTIAFCCLGYRLVDLQVVQHEKLRKLARVNTHQLFLRETRRGEIRDRRGNLLAGTLYVKTVNANPSLIAPYQEKVARVLAPLLEMDEQVLLKKLEFSTFVDEQGRLKVDQHSELKDKVSLERWERIQEAMKTLDFGIDESALSKAERQFFWNLRHRAIYSDRYDDQLRVYPNKQLAAHVIGYVGATNRQTMAGNVRELAGSDGIERVMDAVLRGVPGWRQTEYARSRELVTFRNQDVDPQAGRNVVLTLDAGLQHIVESELAEVMLRNSPDSVSAIVVQPRTGEILAMATLPTYDPNRLQDSQPEHRRNRAITDMLEPGSTFKIVPISAALAEGLVTLDTRVDCEGGRWFFAGRSLKDDHPAGVLTVEQVVGKSSNIGTAKIAVQLGAARLYEYARRFGFGSRTGVSLAGELNGWLHPPKRWSKLSLSRIPIGQGVAVTPIQMVMAMSAIANGGRLMRPMLVDRIEDENGNILVQYGPEMVRQVVNEEVAKEMVTALKSVMSTNATGRKARLDYYTCAGKTGTAQKVVNGGYSHSQYFASFVGFFPADAPELCIAVILDDPKGGNYYGGSTAGPAFKHIAERAAKYLAIKPEIVPPEALAAASMPLGRLAPGRGKP